LTGVRGRRDEPAGPESVHHSKRAKEDHPMTRNHLMKWTRLALIFLAAVGLCEAVQADTGHSHSDTTTTPIKHLVVIY